MERAVIKWYNHITFCKIAFGVINKENSEKIYLLTRDGKWPGKELYGIPHATDYECEVEEARELWEKLTGTHKFKQENADDN